MSYNPLAKDAKVKLTPEENGGTMPGKRWCGVCQRFEDPKHHDIEPEATYTPQEHEQMIADSEQAEAIKPTGYFSPSQSGYTTKTLTAQERLGVDSEWCVYHQAWFTKGSVCAPGTKPPTHYLYRDDDGDYIKPLKPIDKPDKIELVDALTGVHVGKDDPELQARLDAIEDNDEEGGRDMVPIDTEELAELRRDRELLHLMLVADARKRLGVTNANV